MVRAVVEGQPLSVAARRCGVSRRTVKQTGSLVPRRILGGVRRLGPHQQEVVLARLERPPDATVCLVGGATRARGQRSHDVAGLTPPRVDNV